MTEIVVTVFAVCVFLLTWMVYLLRSVKPAPAPVPAPEDERPRGYTPRHRVKGQTCM